MAIIDSHTSDYTNKENKFTQDKSDYNFTCDFSGNNYAPWNSRYNKRARSDGNVINNNYAPWNNCYNKYVGRGNLNNINFIGNSR